MKSVQNVSQRVLVIFIASLCTMCRASGEPDDFPDEETSGNEAGDEDEPGKGEKEETCEEDSVECVDETLIVCADGEPEEHSCEEYCGQIGFSSTGCEASECECGEPLDEECAVGTGAFCTCAAAVGKPCSDAAVYEFYLGCFHKDPEYAPVRCFEDHVAGGSIDCAAATVDCVG